MYCPTTSISNGTVIAVRGFTAGAFRMLLMRICCAVFRIVSNIVYIFIRRYHGARSGKEATLNHRTRAIVQG